jgi:predicted enzyme related to lactoylglutathione lyase
MAHRSRLGSIVIDCQGADLAEAIRFWSGALGWDTRPVPEDDRYATVDAPADQPKLLLQRVEHPSRVHLDIETDDQEAERARLEGLGATVVERHPKGWIVMQAPTGHRFCLVGPNRPDVPGDASEYP